MYMHEFGDKDAPVILMLHPMGVTAQKIYDEIGSRFRGKYRLLIPDMGNHGEEKSDYVSAEDEAGKICGYLKDNGITEVALIYGASMGAAVALNVITCPDVRFRSMYLDGAPIAKLGFLMSKAFAPVLIWQRGIYEKNDRKKLQEFIDRWGDDLNDHMRETFMGFSDTTIRISPPPVFREICRRYPRNFRITRSWSGERPRSLPRRVPRSQGNSIPKPR
ncbi:MAG: alpha/beta hydrolase [Clostridiales bacterium]|nr:alpha/beta hydrolase [Clostridiales bacterium]